MNSENKIVETGVIKIVKAEQFSGRRRAKEGEDEYLMELLLEYILGPFAKGFLLWIALLMIVLSPVGTFKLVTVVITDTSILDLTTIIVIGVALLFLCLVFCGGVIMLKGFINDLKADKNFKADILNGRFHVVDVSIVAYHYNHDQESSEAIVTIKDYEQNEADKTFTTVNWPEIKGNGDRGVIVIMERASRDTSVLYTVFPCYDANSSFCKKMVAKFRKRRE